MEPRDQDGQVERLRQIVVGASLEPLQHVLLPSARGQHQDRHEVPGGAQFGRHGEAVLARQHDVEDHHVERLPLTQRQVERLLAACGDRDLMPLGGQVEADAVGDVLLVLDDQDSAHQPEVRGSCSVNVAPRPSPSLCANTRPPCALAIDRTM